MSSSLIGAKKRSEWRDRATGAKHIKRMQRAQHRKAHKLRQPPSDPLHTGMLPKLCMLAVAVSAQASLELRGPEKGDRLTSSNQRTSSQV